MANGIKMRFYLDTNILIFLLERRGDEITPDVAQQVFDYGNLLYTNMVCVHELVHLLQIEKRPLARYGKNADISHISVWLSEAGVEVVPVEMRHIETLASLPLYAEHRDPNDRLIVAQAICDDITLVSSDRKFHLYEKSGLKFAYNRR